MKKLIPLFLIVLVVGAYFYFNSSKNNVPVLTDSEAQLILFWGEGCPHCEKVKSYIKDNNLDSKVKIVMKEVYYNKVNQLQLEETVKKCPEIDASQGIGVPLAFDTKNSLCLYGDTPIIQWLGARWYNLSVSLKSKRKEFHFNLGVLFRWIIFALIIYFSINYLSNNYSSTHLSNYSANLNIAGVNTEPLVNEATKTFEQYKNQAINFINDQLIDIKKQVVTKIYDEVIKSIENTKKWI